MSRGHADGIRAGRAKARNGPSALRIQEQRRSVDPARELFLVLAVLAASARIPLRSELPAKKIGTPGEEEPPGVAQAPFDCFVREESPQSRSHERRAPPQGVGNRRGCFFSGYTLWRTVSFAIQASSRETGPRVRKPPTEFRRASDTARSGTADRGTRFAPTRPGSGASFPK